MQDSLKIERIIYHALSAIWRQRKVILIPTLIFPFLGLIVGVVTPKKYESSTTILVQETSRINPFLEDLSISTHLKERMESLNVLLHSRHVLLGVLGDLGEIDEDSNPRVIVDKLDELSRSVSANLMGKELVEIKLRSTNPENMDKKLDIISKRFVEKVLAPSWSSLNSSEKFLSAELERNRESLSESEKSLAEFKSRHSEELPELHASNVERLSKVQSELSTKRGEYAGAKAALESLQSRLIHSNPTVGKLEEKIIKLSGDLALLRARYTEQHSKVQAAARAIQNLQEERTQMLAKTKDTDIEQLWNVASTMFSEGSDKQPLLTSQMESIEKIRAKISSLENEIKKLEESEINLRKKVNNFGSIEKELMELQRDSSVKREVYESMLKRSEMARVTSELGKFEVPDRIKVIDDPTMPPLIVTFPLIVFVLAGVIGGIAMGIGMAVMIESADNTIRYSQQLVMLTNQPVLFRVEPYVDELTQLLEADVNKPKGGASWYKQLFRSSSI